MTTPAIVLFDIDLTMIRTNGAGTAAMTTTMRELAAIEEAFAGMVFAGRTDRAILREAITNAGHLCDDFEQFCWDFEARYLGHLERELGERGGVVLPGVREAVAVLAADPSVRL